MTRAKERMIDKAIQLQIGLTLSMVVRAGRRSEDRSDLGSKGLTAHQRILLGLMLRQRGKRFTLAEAAVFYHATVISLLNRGLVRLEKEAGVIYLSITDEGMIASHQSPPVEVVLREMSK